MVVGEVHDNPLHHEGQAAVVRALAPTAVVLEMLTPDQAARWDPALAADPDVLDDVLGWSEAGWPDVDLYLPLFEAIPEAAAVVGAAPPAATVRNAIQNGAASAFEAAGGAPVAFGLEEPLPADERTAREARQAAAHCDALPAELLPGFVEAQRLRDAAFAAAVLDALEAHGPPVVLVTGNGHAHADWGVPAALSRAAPSVSVHSIVQMEGEGAHPPADEVVVTAPPPEPRPDPCAAFSAG